MAKQGYNWFLIVASVLVAVLSLAAICYLIVYYQHPEDRNQAWFPKVIVVLGLELSAMAVLMFPLDVGNRRACSDQFFVSSCSFAIPMKTLWIAMYWTLSVYAFIIIPFAMFYYDADSEYTLGKKIVTAGIYAGLSALFVFIVLIVAYIYAGYMVFQVQRLSSGLAPWKMVIASVGTTTLYVNVNSGLSDTNYSVNGTYNFSSTAYTANELSNVTACIPIYTAVNYTSLSAGTSLSVKWLSSWITTYASTSVGCDSARLTGTSVTDWKVRPTIAVYLIALSATLGYFGFVLFGGFGIVTLPVDLIRSWKNMPKSVISRAEFVKRAKDIALRAKKVKDVARSLSVDKQRGGGGRKWRRHFVEVQRQLKLLEDDNDKLVEEYPQGTDPDALWVVTVVGYWIRGALGVICTCLGICFFIHIVVYMLSDPPISVFLNLVFSKLDKAFPLLGTTAFGLFCFYLISASVHGALKIGLNFLIFSIHPMKPHATLMSSFLFNTMLVQLITLPVVSFCSKAFADYAKDTTIQQIFGTDVANMNGFKWLFTKNFFEFFILCVIGIALVYSAVTKGGEPYKKKKGADAYIV